MNSKSSVKEIRDRFDREVERFSNLETGQTATIDASLVLELIQKTASRVCPNARQLLDVGCGAGNYSLKLLEALPNLEVTLVDLSRPMLERAVQRLREETKGRVTTLQGDIRELEIGTEKFDLAVAAMVLHHLRTDAEWKNVYAKMWRALRAGGVLWVSDFIEHSIPAVQQMMWERYGEYLVGLKGPEYRDQVFDYVTREDTPRSLEFQFDVMREVGFTHLDVLHKNNCFVVFGGMKPG